MSGRIMHCEPLPPDTEQRIAEFAELVATAISNLEARAEIERLAEEQSALRRVAELVALRSDTTLGAARRPVPNADRTVCGRR